jgi:hypothetical protein
MEIMVIEPHTQYATMPIGEMDNFIQNALLNTYKRAGGRFRNESDFKMELFHNLAVLNYKGIGLAEKVLGHSTPLLHAEGKCENGNPAKADLIICNPSVLQGFNYEVDYIIELKHRLSRTDISKELDKIRRYSNKYKKIYIISAEHTTTSVVQYQDEIKSIGQDIEIILPDVQPNRDCEVIVDGDVDYKNVLKVVQTCIEQCLHFYGNGRQQFHGFYWCNYEHELNKKQTYPCEGDFVCQLYHALRKALPVGVMVESEVLPVGTRNRIDIAISPGDKRWVIPIDVKMNWDQFKHKYDQKTGDLKTAEADLILGRFDAISREFQRTIPITVVIQGDLAQDTDKKARSLNIFRGASLRHTLICYSELKGDVILEVFGE